MGGGGGGGREEGMEDFVSAIIHHSNVRASMFTESFLTVYCRLSVVCNLTKGITPKICRLCVCVIINKRSFEPFMCLDLHRICCCFYFAFFVAGFTVAVVFLFCF